MKRRARAARRPVLDVVSPHEALRMGPQCAQMADALHRQDTAAAAAAAAPSSSSTSREIIAPRVALHLPPPPPPQLLPPARSAETAPDAATLSALLSPRAQQQPQPPDSPPREMPRSGFYAASLDLDLDDLFAADGPPSPPPPVVVRQPLQRLRPQVEDVVVMLPQPTAFLAEPVVAVQIPIASPPSPPKRVEVVEVEDSLPSAAVAAEGEEEEEEEDVVVVGSSQPPRIPLTKRRRNRDEDYVPPKRSKARGNKAGKVEQLRSSPSPSPPPRPSQRRLRSNTRIDESGATASNPVDIDDSLHEDEGQAEAKASKDVFEFDDFCNEGDAQQKQKQHESRITLPPPLPSPSFSTPLPETASTVQKPLVISAAGTPIIPAPRAITESSGDEAVVLVYPPSDPWAVSLTVADIVRLDPDAHLNDSIIEFYLRYVEKELVPPDERGDYHFFNPFFYKKLTGGRSLSQGVLRWTRSLDVLSKRFLVVPINEHEHWSLAIVLDQHAFDDIGCGILLFDSLGSTSSSTHSRRLRRWLSREWLLAEKKKMEKAASEGIEYQQPVEDSGGSGDHFNADVLPAKTLQLPLQQNYSDCGVFLLHYIELFVRQRPDAVSDFSRDWFPPEDIERKRAEVLDLIRCLATDDGKAVLAEVARHSEERHAQRRHSKRQQTAAATPDVDAVEDEEVVMAEQIDDDDEDDDTERIAETPQ